MKKIKNYMTALYASYIIGFGTCAYVGAGVIKDKTIDMRTVNISGIGFLTTTALWGIGTIGITLNEKNKKSGKEEENELEEMLK
jgi:hypothetical protein